MRPIYENPNNIEICHNKFELFMKTFASLHGLYFIIAAIQIKLKPSFQVCALLAGNHFSWGMNHANQ